MMKWQWTAPLRKDFLVQLLLSNCWFHSKSKEKGYSLFMTPQMPGYYCVWVLHYVFCGVPNGLSRNYKVIKGTVEVNQKVGKTWAPSLLNGGDGCFCIHKLDVWYDGKTKKCNQLWKLVSKKDSFFMASLFKNIKPLRLPVQQVAHVCAYPFHPQSILYTYYQPLINSCYAHESSPKSFADHKIDPTQGNGTWIQFK